MKLFHILLAILPAMTFAQIGAKTQQGKIYGLWQNNDFGYQMTLMLNANNTGEFDGEEIKFSAQGSQLTITQQGVSNNYTYALQGNSLTLSGGDLEKPVTFKRGAGNAQATPPAGKTTETTASTAPGNAGIPANLLGTWSGNNETMDFKANGECMYAGQPIKYSVLGNTITIHGANGSAAIVYEVKGDQLTLTANGQSFTYTKGTGGNAVNTTNTPAPGNARVAQELVGKWCYMNVYSSGTGGSYSNECFTLKADGTYEYYSESSRSVNTPDMYGGTSSQGADKGTWTYDGVKLYCNSYTKGATSYKLEKRNHPKNSDPMIVLNGYTYVTYFNKPPW